MTLSSSSHVRVMTFSDLERVLAWRNSPEVRQYMYTQHEITLSTHTQWFNEAKRDPTRHLLIFENNKTPLGFINIHEFSAGGVANWGFYASPCAPKGTGTLLGQAALRYAFNEIDLHKICGQVLDYNTRSIHFHYKLGFRLEGTLREHHFNGTHYHDVFCFGIISSDFNSKN